LAVFKFDGIAEIEAALETVIRKQTPARSLPDRSEPGGIFDACGSRRRGEVGGDQAWTDWAAAQKSNEKPLTEVVSRKLEDILRTTEG